MKQKLQNLFFLFLLGIIGAKAQGPVITAAGFNPAIGDSYIIKYANEITKLPKLTGGNNVWDFSNLIDIGFSDTITYVSPKGLPFSDSFPTSNIATKKSGVGTYYYEDSNAWGLVGFYSYDSTVNSGVVFTYDRFVSIANYMVFPMYANKSFTDSFHHFIKTSFGASSDKIGYDTILGIGYGSLIIPSGTYDSVLCIYYHAGNEVLSGRYLFLTNGVHYPLLEIAQGNNPNGEVNWTPYYISGTTLPLQISSFKASWQNKMPYLQWDAANSANTKQFNIQRSLDGHSFSTVGQVSVNVGSTYHFEDNYKPTSTVYYRLQQVDKNGQTFYSSTARLTVNGQPFTVFPNPARDNVTISGNHIASIQVIDNIGRVIKRISLKDATNPSLSISGLPVGVYHLQVQTTDGKVSGVKMVKE